MTRVRAILWLCFAALAGAALCQLFGAGARSTNAMTAAVAVVSPEPIQAIRLQVGDVLAINDHLVILETTEIRDGVLTAGFLVVNSGLDVVNVSGDRFFATDAGGGVLARRLTGCYPTLRRRVFGGRNAEGSLCWTGATAEATVYYEPDAVDRGRLIWEVHRDAVDGK